ncbi:sensor histidine kinase [Chryseolinea lacunae]|uniref:histidine kinase n=1 Tax=Chryseolinea lacunae TaxID=2801331 RepID=A0ABS1KPJ8_9BACT|nr:ATP-binding protein [Chryseolinea lacunae]MBL0741162.1 tetratricopeptide repeat-containing sensor histidine kinase [Chryseolinea lacunae]
MKYYLAILALLALSVGYSQENLRNVDSLKAEVASLPMDTNRVLRLCDVSHSYHAVDVDSSLHYAEKALELSKQLRYKNGMAWSNLLIGQTYSRRNLVAQAISCYQRSIDIADSVNNKTVMCRALGNIGWCMFDLEDYYRAIDYFKRALSFQEALGKQDPYFVTLKINIGQTYLANRQFGEAEKYLNTVFAYDRLEIPNYGYLLNMLSALRIEQRQYAIADSILNTVWKLISPLPDKIDKADNRYYFAKLKLAQGDAQSAFVYAEEAHHYYVQIGSKADMERIYALLSVIESERGRTKQALSYLLKSNELRDSVHSSRAKYSEYLFNSREQNRKALLQEKDKELLQAEKKNQQLLGIGLLSISIGIIACLLFFVWQRQQTYKKVLALNEKLSVLNDELVKKEAAIAHQNYLLRETNDSKDKLFSIIGHDLRSPINSLMGLMDLLSNHYDLLTPDERHKYLGDLNRSLKNLNNLTGNLLEWSFSQTNALNFIPEIFDVGLALKESEELFSDVAHVKKIVIVNEVKTELLVWAHPHSIRTIIRNLLSNAIKFTREGGQVTLNAEFVDGFVRVGVIDNGVGIREGIMNRLFEIGDKRSTPGTANEKGSGLGLLLCKEFVEKNGGTIEVRTAVGKGSAFYFTVPMP